MRGGISVAHRKGKPQKAEHGKYLDEIMRKNPSPARDFLVFIQHSRKREGKAARKNALKEAVVKDRFHSGFLQAKLNAHQQQGEKGIVNASVCKPFFD